MSLNRDTSKGDVANVRKKFLTLERCHGLGKAGCDLDLVDNVSEQFDREM
jgi:hypothetical protein